MAIGFYATAIVITFKAYREFKALSVEQGGGGMGMNALMNRGPGANSGFQRLAGGGQGA